MGFIKILIFIQICYQFSSNIGVMTTGNDTDTFFYFGYGSNLLQRRIHIQNPTAQRVGAGELEGYRLDFFHYSQRWNGSPATIVEDEEKSVWGAVWKIALSQGDNLDKQEGSMYRALTVPIKMSSNETLTCCVYQLVNNPANRKHGRKPSKTYIETIIEGAIESNLPEDYISFLKNIEHNNELAEPSIIESLKIKA